MSTSFSAKRRLDVQNNRKTAIVYVYHKHDRNVEFFFQHGLYNANADYFIVENHPEWVDNELVTKKEFVNPNLDRVFGDDTDTVNWTTKLSDNSYWKIDRPNICNDFGAYSQAIQSMSIDDYDFFVFVNSSMRGPFLPQFVQRPNGMSVWSQCFTNLLTDDVALVGSSINNYKHQQPHVQSMAMACDRRALDIWLKKGVIMGDKIINKHKHAMIHDHEIRGSLVILESSYNLDCLVTGYRLRDWRHPQDDLPGNDIWGHKLVLGYTVQPFETIFFKTNRNYTKSRLQFEALTRWYENWDVVNDKSLDKPNDLTEWLKDEHEKEITTEQKQTWKILFWCITSIMICFLLALAVSLYRR